MARWAPTIYKWSYNPYKWPYKWVNGVITLLIGVKTPFTTGRGPPCKKSRSKMVVFAEMIPGVHFAKQSLVSIPSGSMTGIFAYIWVIFMVNVGKYIIYRSSGIGSLGSFETKIPNLGDKFINCIFLNGASSPSSEKKHPFCVNSLWRFRRFVKPFPRRSIS